MEISKEEGEKSSPPAGPSTSGEKPSIEDHQPEQQNEQSTQPKKKSAKFKLSVLMLSLVIFVVAMDSVIVAAALPAIAASLRGSSLEAFWVGTAYLLAQTVAIPIYGSISKIFGRKWCVVFAMSAFLFGSILCGSAQTMTWLIAARVVQGLGGGGCVTLANVIISDITTLRERPRFLAISAFSYSLGSNVGVPVGGAIGQYTSWRWIFWINIPVCAITISGIIYSLHLHQEISSLGSKIARIDYLGIFVFVASMTLLLFGLTTGGTTNPWDSVNVLAPLVIGFTGIGIFVFVQWKISKQPMMPLRIFSNRSANAGFLGAFIHGLVLWASAYYMIIFFLGATQHTLLKASVETLPGSAPIALSGVISNLIVAKTMRFQKQTWIAWILLTTGTGLNALMRPNSNGGILYAMRVIPAIGGGFLFQLPVFAVQSTTIDEDLGVATSTVTFFRILGQSVGVAIGGTIFQNQFNRLVATATARGEIGIGFVVAGARAASAYDDIRGFPGDVRERYRYVYADSLRVVWYVTTGIAMVGFLVSLGVRNESMDRGNNSKQRFKEEEKKEKSAVAV